MRGAAAGGGGPGRPGEACRCSTHHDQPQSPFWSFLPPFLNQISAPHLSVPLCSQCEQESLPRQNRSPSGWV